MYFSGYGAAGKGTRYSPNSSFDGSEAWSYNGSTTGYRIYKFVYESSYVYYKTYTRYIMNINKNTTYSRGNFVSNVIAKNGTYTIGSSSKVHSDRYWYVRGSLVPKYTLYKYDENLILKSAYDIDTKVIITVPINIANKGNNKVKLTLNTYGSNYKTYISNDNTNWQEVTGITSGTPKELAVDGWDKLYIKIETNTSRIDNIDVAYYKN